jgi:uncharacterized protein
MTSSWLVALAGGALIGGGASLLLLSHGRIAGISGIFGGLLPPWRAATAAAADRSWQLAFVIGLLISGAIAAQLVPSALGAAVRSPTLVVVAGLLVGFGTRWGSGCTSGHGVCGLSRGSMRSLVAVMAFMVTGALTAWVVGGAR